MDALRDQHLDHSYGTFTRMILLITDIGVNLNMYVDDHQFYTMSSDIEAVNNNLTQSAVDASEWYTSNFRKGNLDKYRILMFGSKLDNNIDIGIDDKIVNSFINFYLFIESLFSGYLLFL